MSGTEPKEQWLCTPDSEPDGCSGIQTSGEKTHRKASNCSWIFHPGASSRGGGYYLFSRLAGVFFRMEWLPKLGAIFYLNVFQMQSILLMSSKHIFCNVSQEKEKPERDTVRASDTSQPCAGIWCVIYQNGSNSRVQPGCNRTLKGGFSLFLTATGPSHPKQSASLM